MISQSMTIRSRQVDVADGELHFTIHPVTGDGFYQGRLGFFSFLGLVRRKLFSGSFQINPPSLQSDQIRAGQIFHVQGVEAAVRVVEEKRAWVKFHAPKFGNAQGVAMLDLSQPVARVIVITGGFSFKGHWRGVEAVCNGDRNPEHR